jgi:Fur family peroxide stress response transcriptional regulator
VYRNLDKLHALGQIRMLRLADGVTRYDGNVDEHDHFVCESCGEVTDLDSYTPSLDVGAVEREGFLVRTLSTTLIGLCPRCAQRSPRKASVPVSEPQPSGA